MADRTITQGDTYPPLRLSVTDENGLVDLASAELVELEAKSETDLITGPLTVIDPPQTVTIDGQPVQVNAEYAFAPGDTDLVGAYTIRSKVTWDSTSTPPHIEHFPNARAAADSLIVEAP